MLAVWLSLVGTPLLTQAGPIAPLISSQPLSRVVAVGSNTVLAVAATGSAPLTFRWSRNGTNLVDDGKVTGSASSTLTISNIGPADAANYRVQASNGAGTVLSDFAALSVSLASSPPGLTVRADAVVLVNSQSARYSDFPQRIRPYLENFGVPYTIQDLSTNAAATNLESFALIVVGHRELDTNHFYLDAAAQQAISQAVSNGIGFVSFDGTLSAGGAGLYTHVQNLFEFSYGPAVSGTSVVLPATETNGLMHYITGLHTNGETIFLRAGITVPAVTNGPAAKSLALCGNLPLASIAQFGQGRAMQWLSTDWMPASVLGPLEGLDDLLWRGMAWAARKPFLIRGLPNLVTLRMDDCSGPFWWVHDAADMGFKPWLGLFLSGIDANETADLRSLVTNGNATASIHSFDCCNRFFFFNHTAGTSYSDSVMSNNFYIGTRWHATNALPISKVVAAHYSEMGTNAFQGLVDWGVEFFPIEIMPGAIEYGTSAALWLMAGPYRLYETPQLGEADLPLWYADWLQVPGHPELNGKLFNVYSEVRDDPSGCHEFCPDNDVAGSVARGYRMLKRELDSMAMATIFTHEWYILPIPQSTVTVPVNQTNWRAILVGITNSLGPYQPQYVTLDYASQYVRATRTSRLLTAAFDPVSGEVTATFSGSADLDTSVYVFAGTGDAVAQTFGHVAAFTGGVSAVVGVLPPATNAAQPLLIRPSPLFQAIGLANGYATLSWAAVPGLNYSVEAKADLSQPSWETVIPSQFATRSLLSVTNPIGASSRRFYRVGIAP